MEPRETCLRCRRPRSTCWCSGLVPVPTLTRVVLLQHPREAKVAIGTARIARLGLQNAELHEGVSFDAHPRLLELAATPGVALLFPGPGAVHPSALPGGLPHTVIVVDGTWAQAKKVLVTNKVLQSFPRIGLDRGRPSDYRIRKEPAEHCLATIEATVELLASIEGDRARFAPMLAAFTRMVDTQIARAATRVEPRRTRRRRVRERKVASVGTRLAAVRERVVLVHVEVNAHGRDAGVEGQPELVQLCAERLSDGARLQRLVRPRRPLAAMVTVRTGLEEAALRGGVEVTEALAALRAFAGEAPVFVGWSSFAPDVLASEGLPAERLVLRLGVIERLRRKVAGVEAAADALGAPWPEAWADGRAGRVLAATRLVAELLLAEALTPRTAPAD